MEDADVYALPHCSDDAMVFVEEGEGHEGEIYYAVVFTKECPNGASMERWHECNGEPGW